MKKHAPSSIIGRRQATLTRLGTWDHELNHDVVESWQRVASGSCHLRVKNKRAHGVINSHDAVHALRLPGGVINPASLWQTRQEGGMQRMA
ncbi:hypothetical protein BKA67DRAFT_565677 [Truncatella angustata]|uniref:DUF6546 domain-containing protein n=1 Tax=Truncatella angustata TaxID=152316 RepID=A0A9P8UM27_9PEZI|nr:uncharacterized protein BKA67DRAFT_565677 [Truncatella angustata]KAH6654594.1 hypothetical protein BKA67DRAFT_565677 [Truncatella angustata]